MAKFCIKCGTKINPGTKFCISCGNKLVIDNEPEVKDKDGFTASDRKIIDDAVAFANSKGKERAKKNRMYAIIAIIFGIIFIGGGIVALELVVGIFLLIAGVLVLAFAVFMFILARQEQKSYDEWKLSQQN